MGALEHRHMTFQPHHTSHIIIHVMTIPLSLMNSFDINGNHTQHHGSTRTSSYELSTSSHMSHHHTCNAISFDINDNHTQRNIALSCIPSVFLRFYKCSREVYHPSQPLHSSYLSLCRSSLNQSQSHSTVRPTLENILSSFMLMMGGTSWPSFDRSVLVDLNTSSKNRTQKLIKVPWACMP